MSFFIPTAATGNGRILVTVGRCGELMGFFYPRIDVYIFPDENFVLQHARETAIAVTASEPFVAMCTSLQRGAESGVKKAMQAGQLHAFHQAIGRVDFGLAFAPVNERRWETVL